MKDIKKIAKRYLVSQQTTGWEEDKETGAIIVYALNAIYYNGKYYSMQTGKEIKISKEDYIRDIRSNMKKGHTHDAIEATGAATIIYRSSNGMLEFLLQERSDFEQYGLLGGCMELGEDYRTCAERELFEEAGIIAKKEKLQLREVYAGAKHVTKYPSGDIVFNTTVLFSIKESECTILEEVDISSETKSLKWFSYSELIKMLKNEPKKFFPNNYPMLLDIVEKFFV